MKVKLALNIVTFIPEGKSEPRIFENPELLKMLKNLDSSKVECNIFLNGASSLLNEEVINIVEELGRLTPNRVDVTSSQDPLPLGYCRNYMLTEALEEGCTHILNLDDDDYLEGFDHIMHVIENLPNDFIYIQRFKDSHFFPSVAGDTADYLLQGKFISNGYACMVMPMQKLIKYRISFPEMIDTYEDNMFYLNLLMKYNGDFIMLANPYYRQVTHPEGEFSMTTKSSDKLRQEEYMYMNFITKFDDYVPKFRKIVECHGDQIYELDKNELIKFEKLYGINDKTPKESIFHVFGKFQSHIGGNSYSEVTEGVPEIVTRGGLRLQIARIVTLEEFLRFNSYYTTYRLISKHYKILKELRDAIKARYYSKENPIPEKFMKLNIIMLTQWNLLSE